MKRCSIWVETVSHKCTVLSLFSTVELEAENVGNAWWHAGACFLLAIIFYSCVLTWWCNRNPYADIMHFIMTRYERTSPGKPRSRLFFIQLPFISQNMLSQNLYCVRWRQQKLTGKLSEEWKQIVGIQWTEKLLQISSLLCVYFLLLPQSAFTVRVSHHLASFNLLFICRQDKDSKDEAAKAEKELEEIRKVILDSGGKLSNRVLQSDVRKQG